MSISSLGEVCNYQDLIGVSSFQTYFFKKFSEHFDISQNSIE